MKVKRSSGLEDNQGAGEAVHGGATERAGTPGPQVVGIDELSIRKGHTYRIIVYPLIISLVFNGVWFGICMVALIELALITPPVSLNLYVIQCIGKASLTDVACGTVPFMILMMIGLLLLWFFPDLATWLPGTMGLGGLTH